MDKKKQVNKIMQELAEQYARKNDAYGDSFGESVKKYGMISALTRISDKFNRLENIILHPDINRGDERILDTLGDLATYCVMTMVEIIDKEGDNKDER